MWILYDLDENGVLDFEEISEYLQKTAYPHLNLKPAQLKAIFEHIDIDGNGTISKVEMGEFLDMVLNKQKDILF